MCIVTAAGQAAAVVRADRRGRTMPELEDDLRATAEDIAQEASDLQEVEEEKTRLAPDDPRVPRLARAGERIARRILPKTIAERRLAEQAADETADGEGRAN
jgi:hypothetical protein